MLEHHAGLVRCRNVNVGDRWVKYEQFAGADDRRAVGDVIHRVKTDAEAANLGSIGALVADANVVNSLKIRRLEHRVIFHD